MWHFLILCDYEGNVSNFYNLLYLVLRMFLFPNKKCFFLFCNLIKSAVNNILWKLPAELLLKNKQCFFEIQTITVANKNILEDSNG